MAVIALLIGLFVGAAAVLLTVRLALVERRRRTDQVIALEHELARIQAEAAAGERALDERVSAAIARISTQALDANSARFLELADSRLSGYVRPLKDSLDRMDDQLKGVERVRQEAYGSLTESVRQLRS